MPFRTSGIDAASAVGAAVAGNLVGTTPHDRDETIKRKTREGTQQADADMMVDGMNNVRPFNNTGTQLSTRVLVLGQAGVANKMQQSKIHAVQHATPEEAPN